MYCIFNVKKLTALILFVFVLISTPVFAEERLKAIVNINQEFSSSNIPKEVEFTVPEDIMDDDAFIPAGAVVTTEIIDVENERRWHKSGYMLLNVKGYKTDDGETVDLKDKNIYLIGRKYKKIDWLDVTLTGTEVVSASAASILIPGVDIAYFFTKGSVEREKHHNWFKSGVSNAYENSIFWFWLKGKPIELEEDEKVILKEIDKEKAYKIKACIEKRKAKKERRAMKKKLKKQKKQLANKEKEIEKP